MVQSVMSAQEDPMSSTTPISALAEVDSITIHAIVNDEIDNITASPHPAVRSTHSMMAGLTRIDDGSQRGGASLEIPMNKICCGAHGLSLWITVQKDGVSRSLLFDTGPEAEVWERNTTRLGLDAGSIDALVLSHWHPDHSGGMVRAIKMIAAAKASRPDAVTADKVLADLHPDRPAYRGIMAEEPLSFEADPSFSEIAQAGAKMHISSEVHTVLDDMFLVSGSIPRRTSFEGCLSGGIRLNSQGQWEKDETIMDERLVLCNLKGKGLVVFTGCSHSGVVNVAQHAVELGGRVPLYTVVGGYHLSNGTPEQLDSSIQGLKALGPTLLMPGHCTGWRFKYKIEQEMPGCMVPVFGGTKYELLVD